MNNAYGTVGMAGNQGDTRPSAYLNYILYDKDYKLLDMGWTAVPASASFAQQQMTIPTVTVKEPGYIFVYLSYEGQSNQWVNFDDFKVTHTKTNVIQSNDYYPFGLSAATSWTREGNRNDFLYNAGSEKNNVSGWYDLPFRNYDAALGRFMQVDPMSVSEMATYQYGANNPVFFNDPMGSDKKSNAQIHADGMAAFHDRVNASASYSGFDTEWATDGGGGGGFGFRGVAEQMKAEGEMRAEANNAKGDPAATAAFGRKYGEEQEVWYEWMEYGGVVNTKSVRVILKPKGGSDTSGCPPGIDCDKFKFSRTDDNGSKWYTPVKTDHHIGKLLEYTKDGKVVEHDIYAKNMMDGIKRTFLEAFPIFKTEAGQELGQDVTESILEKIIKWPFPIPVPFFPENPLPDPSPGWNITPKLAPK
ncbi:MAG TPA: RHS repeat-associated core domain-containing protein [Chryseosolibacter sp.]